jgi:hypothetical protein
MNAYELADKLDLEPYGIYGEQAANMLRQQADCIAELEKEKIRDYDNGAEVGQKPMAWISPLGNLYKSKIDAVKNGEQMINPLYTTPQIKELSNEEIEDLIDNWDFGLDISPKHHMFLLCKTILKKASEK